MNSYLIMCRSLTYAQRTEKTLSRSGIGARIIRNTDNKWDGCGYAVEVNGGSLQNAVSALNSAGIPPRRIITRLGNGAYAEVNR